MSNQFFDAGLEATIAVILSLTARLGFYNLAAGGWVILGGWIGSALFVSFTQRDSPVNPLMLWMFIPLALIQVAASTMLPARPLTRQSAYLFITLGIAILSQELGSTELLASSGATIPFATRHQIVAICSMIFSVAIVARIVATPLWARSAIVSRTYLVKSNTLITFGRFVSIELLLLLAVGFCTPFIHKGVYGSTDYRTLVPLLALMFSKGKPVIAAMISFAAVLLSHSLVQFMRLSSGYSPSLSILLLLSAMLLFTSPANAVLQARKLSELVQKANSNSNPYIVGAAVLVLLVAITIIMQPTDLEACQKGLWLAVLATISLTAESLLGVTSVNWPIFGLFAAYLITLTNTIVVEVIIIVGLLVIFSLYAVLLRIICCEHALVVDLAVLTMIHAAVSTSSVLSGSANVKLFPSTEATAASLLWALFVQVILIILCLLAGALVSKEGRLRAFYMGLANFRLGRQHGIGVLKLFMICAFLLGAAAVVSTVAHLTMVPALTPTQLSLEVGMTVLLLGRWGHLAGSGMMYAVIFLLYSIAGTALAGHALLWSLAVGIALVVLGILGSMRTNNEGTPAIA